VDKYEDVANINFWRFFWLAISLTLMSVGYAYTTGLLSELITYLGSVWVRATPWVLLTMVFAYGANLLGLVVLKKEDATYVAVFESFKVVFAFVLAAGFFLFLPDVFNLPTSGLVWALRIVGTLLITACIVYTEWSKISAEKR
jgi:hypothetical protein